MKQILFIISCILLSTSVQAQSKQKLFNGKDLSGWTIHGTEKWYVEKGNLVCESGPDKKYGYLSTNKKYKNFILEYEFKLEANGNSGVFIRSSIDGTKISGWQVEVAPPGNGTGGIYESYGRGWLTKPTAEKESSLSADGWNKGKIEVNQDEIKTWLNGNEISNIKDAKIGAANGFIALQIHDGGGIKVRWKNIRLKEIN
ncbi:DUF1080 domain-containing protein [Daejeonella sp.]|jgi:hypothetical protein|uniref:3-keto-disaccharide hydrolase n=1 Tax=Daejeonella sp. TaxID=2805397 RepID=UPI0037848350